MDDLRKIPLETLMDRLAFYTKEQFKMMREGATESVYQATKKMLQAITTEIERRKSGSSPQKGFR